MRLQLKVLFMAIMLWIVSNITKARVITETIEYPLDGQAHTGYLAYDDAIPAPRPAVLVVHEWWGLSEYEKSRVRMLAELGYAAFAVDMYGAGKFTNNPDQAREWMQSITTDVEWWRNTAWAGVEILKTKAQADPKRIAAIGYCFGGGTVLQLAYSNAELAGVVSFHGSLPTAEDGIKIKPKILIFHGHADPFIPKLTLDNFQSALEKAHADWQQVSYGGVLHSFTNPHAAEHGMQALKYDAQADNRSWATMKLFLKEILQ